MFLGGFHPPIECGLRHENVTVFNSLDHALEIQTPCIRQGDQYFLFASAYPARTSAVVSTCNIARALVFVSASGVAALGYSFPHGKQPIGIIRTIRRPVNLGSTRQA